MARTEREKEREKQRKPLYSTMGLKEVLAQGPLSTKTLPAGSMVKRIHHLL